MSADKHSGGDVLVSVENVGKRFCRDLKKSLWYGVRDIAAEVFPVGKMGRNLFDSESIKLRSQEFWAVRDVSFELRRGECLALIGRNGAGKTTLLKMLNGLIKPDYGKIEMRGRVGAMIALGAGFNPVLTGRENIYVTGSIRGMSKREIDEKIDDIIDFSEIREFIDMPVQSYSSGMQVRLGFSVATALSPDIMLIDEVLAVGDGAFRFKCLKRIAEMMETSAVILVSHNMDQIGKVCDRGLVMNKGAKVIDGSVKEAMEIYVALNIVGGGPKDSRSLRYVDFPLKTAELSVPAKIDYGQPFSAVLDIDSGENLPGFYTLIRILNIHEQVVAEISNQETCVDLPAGKSRVEIISEKLLLKSEKYTVNILVYLNSSSRALAVLRNHPMMVEGGQILLSAHYQMAAQLRVIN